jgi:adhesin/invasin
VIALSPTALTFNAQQGAANPPNQTVALSNAGGGTFNWTASVTSGAWLTVTPPSGTGAATLTIAASSAGLNPGTYNGTVQVAVSGAGNTPQTLAVTFTVVQAAASAISLTPNSLQFTATAGSNPATQTFQVLNVYSTTLGWTAAASTQTGGNWLSVSPSSGVSPATLTVTVSSAALANGVYLGGITITALSSSNATNSPQVLPVSLAVSVSVPAIGQNGIVDGAGFASTISAGGIASLFGTNLAASTASAAAVPLPTILAGTQVLVNGVAAPLFYVSPKQINFQMPAETVGASVSVVVVSGGINSVSASVNIAAAGPGIFTVNSNGQGQAALLNQDNSVNSAQNPAAAGSVIQIFATGLGLTNPAIAAGQPGSSSPLDNTVSTPVVTIDGVSAVVGFSGLAPGFVGLYQVNVTVPAGTASGSATLQIQINGQSSNTATVAIK